MNWKLVLTWSTLGLINGVLSLFGTIHGIEYWIWLCVMLLSGVAIGLGARTMVFRNGLVAGLLATVQTGLTQALFMDFYFSNNPGYAAIAGQLEMGPVTYTLAMTPVFAACSVCL